MVFLINAIKAVECPTHFNKLKIHELISYTDLRAILKGISFTTNKNILYFFEDFEVVRKKLTDSNLHFTELESQRIDLRNEDSRRFLTNLTYSATRVFFRKKGFICGKIGKRGNHFNNTCLNAECSKKIGYYPRIGQLHQGMNFYFDFIDEQLILYLKPIVNLLIPLSNILANNLLQIQDAPCSFVALCNDYCSDPCFLPRVILAPSPNENNNFFEISSKQKQCPDARDIRIFVGKEVVLPEKALYLLSSSDQQRKLGLSEAFISFKAYRYAGKIRTELFDFLNFFVDNREITVPLASSKNLVFDTKLLSRE